MPNSTLLEWFQGSVNRRYTVSDVTSSNKMTGPLPVTLTGAGGGTPLNTLEAGSSSQPDNSIVTVNATSTQLVAAASGVTRRTTILYNTGSQTVYIREGAAPTAGTHFPIPAGASFRSTSLLAINGIVTSGTGTCAVISEAL